MQKKSVKPPSGHFGQGAIGIAHSALPRAPTLYGDPQLLRKAHPGGTVSDSTSGPAS